MPSTTSKRRARAQSTQLFPPTALLANVRKAFTARMLEKRTLNGPVVAKAVDIVVDGMAKPSTVDLALSPRQWDEVVKIAKELGLDQEEAVARYVSC